MLDTSVEIPERELATIPSHTTTAPRLSAVTLVVTTRSFLSRCQTRPPAQPNRSAPMAK